MTTLFDAAITVVLNHEGGYVDNPVDHGGPTNFGLTLHDLKLAGLSDDKDTLKALPIEQAKEIYRNVFWNPGHFDDLTSMDLAICLFDQSILGGPTAVAGLQIMLSNHPDGVLGPLTVAAANRTNGGDLALRFLRGRAKYYCGIVKSNPDQIEFLSGWLDRLFSLVSYCFITDHQL